MGKKFLPFAYGAEIAKKRGLFLCALFSLVLFCGCAPSNQTADDIDLSQYSAEELISLRNEINSLLGESNSPASYPGQPNIAPASPVGDFLYASNGEEIQINLYTGNGGDVVIPDEIDGLPVTRIGYSAFSDSDNRDLITSLTLPQNIKYIDSWALGGLYGVSGVLILPDTVEEIADDAFRYSCYTGIVISSDCRIGWGSFAENSALEFVYIKENVNLQLDDYVFGGCHGLETAILPASLTSIGDDCFESCPKVKIITPAGSYAEEYATRNFVAHETDTYETYVKEYVSYYG